MNLKPQDILFLLKLVAREKKPWSFNKLAIDLGMSPSEVHAAAKRALAARLALKEGDNIWPNVRSLENFLFHGIQYVFVPERGGMDRGMPTAHASAPMDAWFVEDNEPPPVWPVPDGTVRGESFTPLYKSVPIAAKNDSKLYQLLALVDAIRGGRAREQEMAKEELKKRFASYESDDNESANGNRDFLDIGGLFKVSRADLRKLASRYHIRRLSVFGSAARGELRPESDIDLLVEFDDGSEPSLGGMVDIQDAFSQLFGGRKIDVATPAIFNNPYRKRAIEKEVQELYAA